MRDQRIVVCEPAPKSDPGEVKFWSVLWMAVIALLLVSWGLHWTWAEAAAVIKHPFVAPAYTLFVSVIWLAVNGFLLCAVWRFACKAFVVGKTLALALYDVVWAVFYKPLAGLLRAVRIRFSTKNR